MKRVLLYVIFVLCVATFAAKQTLNAPIDCSDGYGHGPDPGTTECESAKQAAIDNRPRQVTDRFVTVVAIGAGGLVLYWLLLPIARLPFFAGPRDTK